MWQHYSMQRRIDLQNGLWRELCDATEWPNFPSSKTRDYFNTIVPLEITENVWPRRRKELPSRKLASVTLMESEIRHRRCQKYSSFVLWTLKYASNFSSQIEYFLIFKTHIWTTFEFSQYRMRFLRQYFYDDFRVHMMFNKKIRKY